MGKLDRIERISTGVITLVAAFAILNGLAMTADPFGWYHAVPSVKFTGPPNQHFLRDIGLIYLTCGGLLVYAVTDLRDRWRFAVAANFWLTFHGLFHLYEVAAGVCSPTMFWLDVPGTIIPPLLVWSAILAMMVREKIAPAGLPKWAILAGLARVGKVDWLGELAVSHGRVFERFAEMVPATAYRLNASADLFHLGRIGATPVEDCGDCALVAANMALHDGVCRDLVNAALSARVPEGMLLTAFDFGQSIALHGSDAKRLGDTIEQAYGRAIRIELALTSAAVRVYPALKRGLGCSQSCGLAALNM